jgi:hypothetical protein
MINKFLWMLGFALISTNVFAVKPGFYIGAALGEATGPDTVTIPDSAYNANTGGNITGDATDIYTFYNRDTTIYHFLAGYNFNPYLGVEAAYSYLGKQGLLSFDGGLPKTHEFNGNLTSYYYGITGVGHIPIKKAKVDLFAKVGIGMVHSKAVIKDPNGTIFVNPGNYNVVANEAAILYGAGAQYYFKPKLAVEVEWNRISRFNNTNIGNVTYNQFLLGVIYSISKC